LVYSPTEPAHLSGKSMGVNGICLVKGQKVRTIDCEICTPWEKIVATQPVIGFRGWSVSQTTEWVKATPFSKPRQVVTGVTIDNAGGGAAGSWRGREKAQALCSHGYARSIHQAPERNCNCGFYVYKQPSYVRAENYGQVSGAVICWGKLIEHPEGFRAEWAQPICITLPDYRDAADQRIAKTVAQALELPLIPYKDLVTYCGEFGQIVPD
jgi:hypothetical protein